MLQKDEIIKVNTDISSSYNRDVITSRYLWFQSNFGKSFLNNNHLSKKDLLIHLFGNKDLSNGTSLKYILEKDSDFNVFGSIHGTYDFNYPIRFSKTDNSWKISNCSFVTEKNVTTDAAINELDIVVSEFIDIFNKVEKLMPFDNVSKYSELDVFIKYRHKRFYNKMWFLKYLHMLYPNIFSTYYNNGKESDWLPVLINILGINKITNNKLICNGQISMYANSINISNYDFSLSIYKILSDNNNFISPFNTENARKLRADEDKKRFNNE